MVGVRTEFELLIGTVSISGLESDIFSVEKSPLNKSELSSSSEGGASFNKTHKHVRIL